VRTAVNNREPIFQDKWRAGALLLRVLREVKKMFPFEMRGFALEGARLSFYIKPADGFQLPAIMQWLKQTFAVRFNRRDGRTGHIWGDRYWSEVLEGEPPEGAVEVDWAAVKAAAETPAAADRRQKRNGVRPHQAGKVAKPEFSPEIPLHSASPPA
jgi:REP element-mobilizing transposase RayT